ncbi:MAG: hypothetical protein WB392_09270 [Methanotrichaceae archaeon]
MSPSPRHAGLQAAVTIIILEAAADNASAERSEGRPAGPMALSSSGDSIKYIPKAHEIHRGAR